MKHTFYRGPSSSGLAASPTADRLLPAAASATPADELLSQDADMDRVARVVGIVLDKASLRAT